MKIVNSLSEKLNNTAVALGYFDGVHLGHRAVINKMLNCKKAGLATVVFTFEESPACVLGKKTSEELTTQSEKNEILSDLGVDFLYSVDFKEIMDYSPQRFVKEILFEKLGAKKVFCGYNYHFGKNGQGDAHALVRLCKELSIECEISDKVLHNGEAVSSTKIREYIKSGDVQRANLMLKGEFGFTSEIIHGNKLGRKMDTPTINQLMPSELVTPLFGVYATVVTIDGKKYIGATNFGVKPTVGSNTPLCETWILDFCDTGESLYGKSADLRFKKFIREEICFSDISTLEAQIKADGENIKMYFESI